MAKICPRYAQDMPMICPRYALDMPRICVRYATASKKARMKFAQIWGKMSIRILESPFKNLGPNVFGAFCLGTYCPLGKNWLLADESERKKKVKVKGKLLKLFVFTHWFVANHFPHCAQH